MRILHEGCRPQVDLSAWIAPTAHSFNAVTIARDGSPLATYANQAKQPTLEDFGETTLTAGAAYVALDPHFASALSRSQPYMVFVTPLGPTQQLYVTSGR